MADKAGRRGRLDFGISIVKDEEFELLGVGHLLFEKLICGTNLVGR